MVTFILGDLLNTLAVSTITSVINFLGIGFIAGSPTRIGNPGLVTIPTPGPAQKIIPVSISSTFTFINAPCVTSGSSPASLTIPTSTHFFFFSW